MYNNKQLTDVLRDLQDNTIGLFNPRFYPPHLYIPVIEEKDGLLTCVEVGTLLGLQTLHVEIGVGRYIPFTEENKAYADTLAGMMKDPMAFYEWYNQNVYHQK